MMNGIGQGAGRRLRRRGACYAGSRGTRTTGLAAAAVAYLADDLRDPQGLARPVLRRAARSLAASRLALLRGTGTAYLRLDREPDLPAAIGGPDTSGRAEIIEAVAVDVTDERDER
jgi:hypothetical protein